MICPHCQLPIVWKRLTPQIRLDIIKHHEQGFSLRDIERMVGVSFSTAGRVIRDYREKLPRVSGAAPAERE